jgi:FkbM family methyltransferase
MAVGETCGEVILNVSANNGESSSILSMKPAHLEVAPHRHAAYADSLRVKCHRLDTVLSLECFVGPDQRIVLKIDVQGYELPILYSAGWCPQP